MPVGVIGLGSMGAGMAKSLIRAGHEVTVWNRSRDKAEALAGEGARVADGLADAVSGEAVVTMLGTDEAVREVVLESGALEQAASGLVHVMSATISPDLSEELARRHAERGLAYVAAPVLGRPDVAEKGELNVLVSGEEAAISRAKPVLDAIGAKTWPIGPEPRHANVAKLAANFMIAAAMETMAEAFAMLEKQGVEPNKLYDLVTSTLFAAPVYRNYGRMILEGRYEPVGFALPLGLKDMRLVHAAGEAVSAPMPLASLLRDNYIDALAHGGETKDWSAVAEVARRRAGLAD